MHFATISGHNFCIAPRAKATRLPVRPTSESRKIKNNMGGNYKQGKNWTSAGDGKGNATFANGYGEPIKNPVSNFNLLEALILNNFLFVTNATGEALKCLLLGSG